MTILNVISANSLTNYLGKTKTTFNMVALVEQYEEALNVSDKDINKELSCIFK